MAEGRSNQAICDRLYLSPKTVEGHVHSIFTRLDLAATPTTIAASSPSLHSRELQLGYEAASTALPAANHLGRQGPRRHMISASPVGSQRPV